MGMDSPGERAVKYRLLAFHARKGDADGKTPEIVRHFEAMASIWDALAIEAEGKVNSSKREKPKSGH